MREERWACKTRRQKNPITLSRHWVNLSKYVFWIGITTKRAQKWYHAYPHLGKLRFTIFRDRNERQELAFIVQAEHKIPIWFISEKNSTSFDLVFSENHHWLCLTKNTFVLWRKKQSFHTKKNIKIKGVFKCLFLN